jgi:hypothetical protein
MMQSPGRQNFEAGNLKFALKGEEVIRCGSLNWMQMRMRRMSAMMTMRLARRMKMMR